MMCRYLFRTSLFTFILFAFINLDSFAQRHFIGLHVHNLKSNIKSLDDYGRYNNYSHNIGVGLSYEYYFNNRLSIESGLQFQIRKYTQPDSINYSRGTQFGGQFGTTYYDDSEFSYTYLNTPILLKYSYGNSLFVCAAGGIAPSYILNNEINKVSSVRTENIEEFNSSFDFGLHAEIGLGCRFDDFSSAQISTSYQSSYHSLNTLFISCILKFNLFAQKE